MRLICVTAGIVGALIGAAGQSACAFELEFVAESGAHRAAAAQYQKIWQEDGARIVDELSRATGVGLDDKRIRVMVREAIGRSGVSGQPMILRASYPKPTRRATLVHELAHRYLIQLESDTEYSDVHFPLSLLLYEVWSNLWSEEFARTQAEVGSARSKRYRQAWNRVLSMSDQDRTRIWNDYVSGRPAQAAVPNPAP